MGSKKVVKLRGLPAKYSVTPVKTVTAIRFQQRPQGSRLPFPGRKIKVTKLIVIINTVSLQRESRRDQFGGTERTTIFESSCPRSQLARLKLLTIRMTLSREARAIPFGIIASETLSKTRMISANLFLFFRVATRAKAGGLDVGLNFSLY